MRYISYLRKENIPQKKKSQTLQWNEIQSKLIRIVSNYLNSDNDMDIDDILFIKNNLDDIKFFKDINNPKTYIARVSTPKDVENPFSFIIIIEDGEIIIDKE